MATATERVCMYLCDQGATSADMIGCALWPSSKRRGVSSNGGGYYAAQMLLGRMRKRGLVFTLNTPGASVWQVTAKGMRLADAAR